MTEIWKSINGYEGLYEVSNLGNVRSLDRFVNGKIVKQFVKGKVLTIKPYKNRYNSVGLAFNGKTTSKMIHRLVAIAFIPNLLNKPEVNHLDENQHNNNVENLEWCTSKENANYGTRNERCALPQRIKVVKLDDNLKALEIYDSCTNAGKANNVGFECIIRVCKGRYLHSAGFRWMYYKDYIAI